MAGRAALEECSSGTGVPFCQNLPVKRVHLKGTFKSKNALEEKEFIKRPNSFHFACMAIPNLF